MFITDYMYMDDYLPWWCLSAPRWGCWGVHTPSRTWWERHRPAVVGPCRSCHTYTKRENKDLIKPCKNILILTKLKHKIFSYSNYSVQLMFYSAIPISTIKCYFFTQSVWIRLEWQKNNSMWIIWSLDQTRDRTSTCWLWRGRPAPDPWLQRSCSVCCSSGWSLHSSGTTVNRKNRSIKSIVNAI